jgi:hypothetical protein
MKNFKLKYVLFLIVFLFSTLFINVSVYAVGPGIPGSSGVNPLSYVSCTLEDGTKVDGGEISALQPKFTLLFDKNIVDILVWEQNRKCVSMSTDNNTNVAIDVTKIDDTVDFDHRQQIFVQPLKQLEPGKTYHIKVGPNLLARNFQSTLSGTTGGKGIDVSFKTKKQETAQGTNTISVSNQNTSPKDNEIKNSEQPKTENSNSSESSNNSNKPSAEQKVGDKTVSKTEGLMGKMSTYWLDFVVGLIIIAWIAFEVIKRRKKERSNKPQV